MKSNIERLKKFLMLEEKSNNTIDKYIRDIKQFLVYLNKRKLTKQELIDYKKKLIEQYEPTSVNSIIAAINKYLEYISKPELKLKYIKIQQNPYLEESNTLTKQDYYELCKHTKKNSRDRLMLTTICSTGIRVSELKYFTVEAVKNGSIVIRNKNKIRKILIPEKLKIQLLSYAKDNNINSNEIFITRNGKPLDRSYIWKKLKTIAKKTGIIDVKKVFPHNLRKLFARQFYEIKKDIVKLADVLGHTNINTTRIYLKTPGNEHKKIVEVLKLIY